MDRQVRWGDSALIATGRRVVVLMTGTIEANPDLPEGTSLGAEQRVASYRRNLDYWIERKWLWGVVFAENSQASAESLARVMGAGAGSRVELLATRGNAFPGAYGKGYGEAELLDRAFDSSKLIGTADLVAKVTGLQIVTNLEKLLRLTPQRLQLSVDLREHHVLARLRIGRSARRCDTRCFLASRSAYQKWLAGPHHGHAGREFFLEDAYYGRTRQVVSEEVRLRFPIELSFRGSAGHWRKDYGSTLQRAKWVVRSVVRRAIPGLWV